MSEAKNYEVDDFRFEFEPEGNPYKGLLITRFPDLQPYPSKVDLTSSKSRNSYVKEACENCGMIADDLKAALISLCAKRTEDVAAAKASKQNSEEDKQEEEVSEEDINQRVGKPGVLDRFVEDAATFSRVKREQNTLRLLTLGCHSAQLDLLPDGKPMSTNIILSAEAGRGKNHACDAIARMVPEDFYFEYVSSSAKALYYAAEKDPAFLKHRWIYPNEAEGTDLLVEMFRPLLSGGKAKHITVNKDANGSNSGQQFTMEGPITLTIPTVRNKIDTQLQSRMLIAELTDYEGRVADHSRAVSELLSRDYAATDYTGDIRAWKAALKTLTGIRRVVTPVFREEFGFDSDSVSHGARLWRNVLGLMSSHAWLEQRNREIISLENGEKAIVATPEDYEVAYNVFKATCERSVINLSDLHRKILDAVYALQEEAKNDPEQVGWLSFSQRKIEGMSKKLHGKAYVRQSSISDNKTFLVRSVKFLREPWGEGTGLALVEDADPSWWEKGNILKGFPRPEQVKVWWTSNDSSDPSYEPAHGSADSDDRGTNSDDRGGSDHANGLDKPNSVPNPSVIDDIGGVGTEKISSSENEVLSAVEENNPERILMIVRECRELFESDPEWGPREVHEEELLAHASGLSWGSPLSDKGYGDDEIFEALKIIYRTALNPLTMASAF